MISRLWKVFKLTDLCIRELERQAATGDLVADAKLRHARCRGGTCCGHSQDRSVNSEALHRPGIKECLAGRHKMIDIGQTWGPYFQFGKLTGFGCPHEVNSLKLKICKRLCGKATWIENFHHKKNKEQEEQEEVN